MTDFDVAGLDVDVHVDTLNGIGAVDAVVLIEHTAGNNARDGLIRFLGNDGIHDRVDRQDAIVHGLDDIGPLYVGACDREADAVGNRVRVIVGVDAAVVLEHDIDEVACAVQTAEAVSAVGVSRRHRDVLRFTLSVDNLEEKHDAVLRYRVDRRVVRIVRLIEGSSLCGVEVGVRVVCRRTVDNNRRLSILEAEDNTLGTSHRVAAVAVCRTNDVGALLEVEELKGSVVLRHRGLSSSIFAARFIVEVSRNGNACKQEVIVIAIHIVYCTADIVQVVRHCGAQSVRIAEIVDHGVAVIQKISELTGRCDHRVLDRSAVITILVETGPCMGQASRQVFTLAVFALRKQDEVAVCLAVSLELQVDIRTVDVFIASDISAFRVVNIHQTGAVVPDHRSGHVDQFDLMRQRHSGLLFVVLSRVAVGNFSNINRIDDVLAVFLDVHILPDDGVDIGIQGDLKRLVGDLHAVSQQIDDDTRRTDTVAVEVVENSDVEVVVRNLAVMAQSGLPLVGARQHIVAGVFVVAEFAVTQCVERRCLNRLSVHRRSCGVISVAHLSRSICVPTERVLDSGIRIALTPYRQILDACRPDIGLSGCRVREVHGTDLRTVGINVEVDRIRTYAVIVAVVVPNRREVEAHGLEVSEGRSRRRTDGLDLRVGRHVCGSDRPHDRIAVAERRQTVELVSPGVVVAVDRIGAGQEQRVVNIIVRHQVDFDTALVRNSVS